MAGLAGMCLAFHFYNIMFGFSPTQNQQDVIDTNSPDYSIQFRCLDVLLGCSRNLSAGIKPKPQNLLVLCLVVLAGDVEKKTQVLLMLTLITVVISFLFMVNMVNSRWVKTAGDSWAWNRYRCQPRKGALNLVDSEWRT